MTVTPRQKVIALALLANVACWGVFLLRDPIPAPEMEEREAAVRLGDSTILLNRPLLVAKREIPEGPWLMAYQYFSFPGLAAGFLLDKIAWQVFAARHNDWLLRGTEWVWASQGNASCLLAGELFVGTSIWWSMLGWLVNFINRRFRPAVGSPGNNNQLDNKELERTRSTQTAVGPRRSIQCSTDE